MVKPNIYCIGGANIDYKFKSTEPMILHTSNPISSHRSFGGVARNVAENLAHQTSNIYLQCVTGEDANGKALLNHMNKLGVNCKHSIMVKGKNSSHYYAILNQDGELFTALAEMSIYDHIDLAAFTNSWNNWTDNSLVFIDANLPKDIIACAINTAKQKNIKLMIDPVSAIKAKKIPDNLKGIFLIKPDRLEATTLTNIEINTIDDAIRAGQQLLERGAQNCVISLGSLGYIVINDSVEKYVQATKTNIMIDATGAGDAFIAGILLGLQQNNNLLKACALGASAAYKTIQSFNTVI